MLLIFNFLYIMFVFLFLCIYTNPAIVCYMNTRSPASAGIANRPLVFLGIFLIFGSNTATCMVRREPASLLITLRQSLCLWRQYTLYTGLGTKRFIAIVFVTFRCRNIAKKTQIPLRISVKRQKES